KLRAVFLEDMLCRETLKDKPHMSLFKMDSVLNHEAIASAVEGYACSELLRPLANFVDRDRGVIATASQKLYPTFTNKPLHEMGLFFQKNGELWPMPGGHGQVYWVLRDIFEDMYRQGKKFVYISNIDNIGALVSRATVAYMALTGKQAAFDFSFKTESDVKGGVAIIDENGRTNCADLGMAISKEALREISPQKELLFNNATGLFNLDWLVKNLDRIIEFLPMRISTQVKEVGTYKQAEQSLWEVMGLMEDKTIIAVNKYERFLAAKLFVETLMNSAVHMSHPKYPEHFRNLASQMSVGFSNLLRFRYGLELIDGVWTPKTVEQWVGDRRSGF
ncbi:MAG: UTP--glucose-1-phosphate uridylyltransferase, partial [Candidatus Margulisiibacteriota bacterium]